MCASCGVLFFFQAEDGIRDIGVTGVQTCALPIYQKLGKAQDTKIASDGRQFASWPTFREGECAGFRYYTPDVLTQCIVRYALKELLRGKTADDILGLNVCEPALGCRQSSENVVF